MKEQLTEFETAVRREWQSLKASLGGTNPFEEWLHRRVPQEGTYGETGDRRYQFRGMGVAITTPDYAISFDVTSDSHYAIFDAQKLLDFIVSKGGEWAGTSETTVRAAIAKLANSGDMQVDTYRAASYMFLLEESTPV